MNIKCTDHAYFEDALANTCMGHRCLKANIANFLISKLKYVSGGFGNNKDIVYQFSIYIAVAVTRGAVADR